MGGVGRRSWEELGAGIGGRVGRMKSWKEELGGGIGRRSWEEELGGGIRRRSWEEEELGGRGKKREKEREQWKTKCAVQCEGEAILPHARAEAQQ